MATKANSKWYLVGKVKVVNIILKITLALKKYINNGKLQ
jgi:hypothetical protein